MSRPFGRARGEDGEMGVVIDLAKHRVEPGASVEDDTVYVGEIVDDDDEDVSPVDPPSERELTLPQRALSGRTIERAPVRAEWIANPEQRREVVRFAAAHAGHRVKYHGVRAPIYAAKLTVRAPVGAGRLMCRVGGWVFDREAAPLRAEAVGKADVDHYLRLAGLRADRVRLRATIVAGCVVVLATGAFAGHAMAPRWAFGLACAVVLAGLGLYGANRDKPVIGRAVIATEAPRLTADLVSRGLGSIGIGGITVALARDPHAIGFPSPIMRDGPGWRADVDLPAGVTAGEVMDRRDKLASALGRPLGCVWPEGHPEIHPGRLTVWVGDKEVSQARQDPWPLLKAGTADLFRSFPFGTDARGRAVPIQLMETNVLIGAIPGYGKALDLCTPVPTPSGWTTMGELRDGDEVYDEAGQVCRVVQAHAVRYDRPCFEVVFSDGSTIVADEDHLWQVDTFRSRHSEQARRRSSPLNKGGSLARDMSSRWVHPEVVSTGEMADNLRVEHGSRLNYSVRVAAAIQAPAADLPIGPYTLGAWLGDGASREGLVYSADPEVSLGIATEGEGVTLAEHTTAGGRCPGYRVDGLTKRLRILGVQNDKHIPAAYLRASEDQRRALLAGLLDTDGTCNKAGQVMFSVTNERLARDTFHLIATLGYKPTITTRAARLYGKDCGTAWQVQFTPVDKVFRLPRKLCRQRAAIRETAKHRYITEIRPVPSRPVRCITVDSPNSLYLVGEACIPTHNTRTKLLLLLAAALDVRAELWVYELKGTGDLECMEKVAARYASGQDDDTIEAALLSLRELYAECQKRAERIKAMPRDLRPENKVTPQMAGSRRHGLHPLVVAIDELQELTGHAKFGKEAGELLVKIVKLGRALGIILLLATQRPDKDSMPTGITANVGTRFCLRVMSWIENDMILGTGAYKSGVRATMFTKRDKGMGYLVGAGDDAMVVRTYFVDGPAADRVAVRARGLREAAGTLEGFALHGAQVQVERPRFDLLTDILACVGGTEEKVWSCTLLTALAELRPDAYEGWDETTFAKALGAHAVKTIQISKNDDDGVRRNWRGVEIQVVREAAQARGERGSE